jgi:c-di-GMP-related signal transduction protein
VFGPSAEEVVKMLPLSPEIRLASIAHEGKLGMMLNLALACERTDQPARTRIQTYDDACPDSRLAGMGSMPGMTVEII